MSTLQLTFARQYRKKQTGKLVFVYNVKGTAAQLDAYRDAQGSYLVEDEKGQPLFFTSRYVGEACPLVANHEGDGFYADTTTMDKQAAMVQQYGGNLGQALAAQIASSVAGNRGAGVASQGTPETAGKGLGNI
jgi:hypothetical protein